MLLQTWFIVMSCNIFNVQTVDMKSIKNCWYSSVKINLLWGEMEHISKAIKLIDKYIPLPKSASAPFIFRCDRIS